MGIAQDAPNELQFTLVYTEQDRQFKQASQWAATLRARGSRSAVHVVPSHIKDSELADYAVSMLQQNKTIACPAGMRRVASLPSTSGQELCKVASSSSISLCEGLRRVSSFPGCVTEAMSPNRTDAFGTPPGVWSAQSQQLAWSCQVPAWPRDEQIDQRLDWEAMQQWPQETLKVENIAMQGQFNDCKPLSMWPENQQLQQKITPPCSPGGASTPTSFVDAEACKWSKPVADVLGSIFKTESWEDIQNALLLSEPEFYED